MCTISAKSTQKCFSSLPTMVPAPHPHPTESLSCSQWSASIRVQHLLGEDWVPPRTNFSDTGDAEILDFSGFVTEQRGFPAGIRGKQLACNAGDATCEGSIPGWGDPPEAGMAAHSSALAWRIPWTEEPGGLQSMGSRQKKSQKQSRSRRVRHDIATKQQQQYYNIHIICIVRNMT